MDVTEAERKAYLEDIRTVLRRDNAEGGAETQASLEFRKELRVLADIEGKIQTLAHMMSSSHRS